MKNFSNLQGLIFRWQNFLNSINDWCNLIKDIKLIKCGCGLVYELSHICSTKNESFAIADMSNLTFSEPHYHPELEVYFILQGSGIVVVGGQEQEIKKESVVIIPPNIAHFTIPDNNLVMAVVNTPPFNLDHYYPLIESNSIVQFDKTQFNRLAYRDL